MHQSNPKDEVMSVSDKGVTLPIAVGLGVGIAVIAIFAVFSGYNPPKVVPTNPPPVNHPDTYNLTVGSKSYLVSYHFQSKDAQLLNMTSNSTEALLKISVHVPNNTALELRFPYEMRKALFNSCPRCTEQVSDLVFFDDSIQGVLNETSTKPETVLAMQLDKGTSVVEIVGTFPL